MRWGLLGIATIGCTPGEDGDAYVLADRHAAETRIRVDGAPVDAAFPVAFAPASRLETEREELELGPDEVALVQGSNGRVDLYVIGVDVEPGLVEASGAEEAVTALADDLGVDLEATFEGYLLGDPEIWALLASAPIPEERITFRPVSGHDLPGTAPLGDPGAVRETTDPSLVARVTRAVRGGSAPPDEAQRATARAEALFDVAPGATELAPSRATAFGAELVGRYCARAAGVVLTLGANGVATSCGDGACTQFAWSPGDGSVTLGASTFAVERRGAGWALQGNVELVDLVAGGCP